jgi:hypothetical protein
MTLALLACAVLGLSLLAVVLTLLAGAIVRSRADRRLVVAARHRHAREHRHTATSHPHTGWVARPDAS